MPLVLAAMPFCASVTDIRRLQNSEAMAFHVFRAGFITGLATGAAVLAELFAAWFAYIPVMLTRFAVKTGIIGTRLNDFDVALDFL